MIYGTVSEADEAVISVVVCGPTELRVTQEAVVDTGFSDYLTLPPEVIALLKLPFRDMTPYTLANGKVSWHEVYRGRVIWHRAERPVLIVAAEGEPLIGMALLRGSRFSMDVIPNGRLTIRKLPR